MIKFEEIQSNSKNIINFLYKKLFVNCEIQQ